MIRGKIRKSSWMNTRDIPGMGVGWGSTYPDQGVTSLDGGYLPWMGGPTLAEGYLPWMGGA